MGAYETRKKYEEMMQGCRGMLNVARTVREKGREEAMVQAILGENMYGMYSWIVFESHDATETDAAMADLIVWHAETILHIASGLGSALDAKSQFGHIDDSVYWLDDHFKRLILILDTLSAIREDRPVDSWWRAEFCDGAALYVTGKDESDAFHNAWESAASRWPNLPEDFELEHVKRIS